MTEAPEPDITLSYNEPVMLVDMVRSKISPYTKDETSGQDKKRHDEFIIQCLLIISITGIDEGILIYFFFCGWGGGGLGMSYTLMNRTT